MWSTLCAVFVIALWASFKWSLGYWKRRGVDGPSPLPFVGNMKDYLMGKMHFGLVFDRIYKNFPAASYVGFFKFTTPTLLLRDPAVVHEVLVSKYSAFAQNDFYVNEEIDPLLTQSPFVATGDKWKESRAMVSPIFTLSRVKQLFPIVSDTVTKLLDHIDQNIDSDVEAKTLFFKYTMENVASCAFGLEGGCFDDPENSEFFVNGSNVFAPNVLFAMTTLFFPGLTHFIKVPAVSPRMDQWLRCIVGKVVESREKDVADSRNDFLQYLINLRANKPEQFTKDTLVGNCLTFLTEGTETSSITLTYFLYEMARDSQVQERLLKELNEVTDSGNNPLTGDLVNELKFMDQCIDETFRLHPVALSLNKICTQRVQLEPQYESGKKCLEVEPGTRIVIPVWSIFRDPKYFVNPEKFDPDRYLQGNGTKMGFLGFGDGPRLCLGKNFALFQIKMALASIIRSYKVELSKKMKSPPAISAKAFILHCDTGIWLQFHRR